MKISTRPFRLVSGSKVMASAAMLAALASGIGATSGTATAAAPKPIPAPTSFQILANVPDTVYLYVSPSTGFTQDYQLISGPNTAGSPILRTIGGSVLIGGLIANSDYVVRIRNVKTSASISAWVNFAFHTATTFASRPNPPQNLRVVQTTATQVTVMWDAPSAAGTFQYQASLNGVDTPFLDCTGAYVSCTNEQLRTRTISRPAPGTSVQFGVTARDANFNLSLPATLVITN